MQLALVFYSHGLVRGYLRHFLSLRIFLPFIPLFVAFDALGILPIFRFPHLKMTRAEGKKVVSQSIGTGFLAGIGFLLAGESVFELLGITVADFKVAGGILLFITAVIDLIFPERTRTFPKETLDVVPIGIPLIVGPGRPHRDFDQRSTLRIYLYRSLPDSQSSHRLALLQPSSPDYEVFERRRDKGDRESLCLAVGCFRNDHDTGRNHRVDEMDEVIARIIKSLAGLTRPTTHPRPEPGSKASSAFQVAKGRPSGDLAPLGLSLGLNGLSKGNSNALVRQLTIPSEVEEQAGEVEGLTLRN